MLEDYTRRGSVRQGLVGRNDLKTIDPFSGPDEIELFPRQPGQTFPGPVKGNLLLHLLDRP